MKKYLMTIIFASACLFSGYGFTDRQKIEKYDRCYPFSDKKLVVCQKGNLFFTPGAHIYYVFSSEKCAFSDVEDKYLCLRHSWLDEGRVMYYEESCYHLNEKIISCRGKKYSQNECALSDDKSRYLCLSEKKEGMGYEIGM